MSAPIGAAPAEDERADLLFPLFGLIWACPTAVGFAKAMIERCPGPLQGTGLQDAPDRFREEMQRLDEIRQATLDYLNDADAPSPISAKQAFEGAVTQFYRIVHAIHMICRAEILAMDVTVKTVRRGLVTRESLITRRPPLKGDAR